MTLLSCEKVKKSFGNIEVLRDINVDIEAGESLGIVGRNGAGKTTLLNIIQGRLNPDNGRVRFYPKRVRIAYLLQSAEYKIIDYDGSCFVENEGDENSNMGDGNFAVTAANTGLYKVNNWSEEQMANLSGGEKTKLALTNIWVSRPDILILDEPTNHMDFKGIEWLISEIGKFRGTCIIVSHDRYFLDKTVKRIVEINDGVIDEYRGNYTFYREEKLRRYEIQLNQYLLQEEYKRKIEGQISNLENWSYAAHRDARRKAIEAGRKKGGKEFNRAKAKKMDIQIKSRIKRLKKIEVEGVEKPKKETGVNFGFEEVKKGGKRLLEAKDISKAFEGKVVFYPSSFYIGRGEKIGIIGPNGCGKTTLLRLILKEDIPDSGELWLSNNAKTAYLSQENKEEDEGVTLIRLLEGLYTNKKELIHARNLLVSMGIEEPSLTTAFNDLSYGERVRVRLANMILGNNDILVLDEPTNHLDLFSREKLEEAIQEYNGTVLFVSHDRYAIAKVCEKLLVFEDQRIRRYEGNFEEYMGRKQKDDKAADSKDNKYDSAQVVNSKLLKPQSEKISRRKLLNNSQRDKDARALLELKMARVLGKLSMLKGGSEKHKPEYEELDSEYRELLKELAEGASR